MGQICQDGEGRIQKLVHRLTLYSDKAHSLSQLEHALHTLKLYYKINKVILYKVGHLHLRNWQCGH